MKNLIQRWMFLLCLLLTSHVSLAIDTTFVSPYIAKVTFRDSIQSLRNATFSIDASQLNNYNFFIVLCGYIDTDSLKDMLLCYNLPNKTTLPKYIFWGDSLVINDSTDQVISRYHTSCLYPNWMDLKGHYSISRFNQDTLWDITIHLSGCIEDSSGWCHDTSRAITIFGQDILKDSAEIHIGIIDTSQNTPFWAEELSLGYGFQDPDRRSFSNYSTYIMKYGNNQQAMIGEDKTNILELSEYDDIQIFPNPVDETINIIGYCSHTIDLKLSVFSLSGHEVIRREVDHKNGNNIDMKINLSSLTSGCYLFKVWDISKTHLNQVVVVIH
jgi:hypothetical protein